MVPVRVRLLLALAMASLLAPLIPSTSGVEPMSAAGLLVGIHQVMIGLAMGFILQLVFAALAIAGESVALSMGLGFASMVDPQNGIQVPIVSSYYVIVATLLFLVLDGHLALFGVLADSFYSLPVGIDGIAREGLWQIVEWASRMFMGALLIALPALTSMLLVNLAFGVITRAAPQLNIFAVGFPVTLLLGFMVLMLSVPSLTPRFTDLLTNAYQLINNLTGN
jgi:flagellar biosynthetic protein FliR